MNIYFRLTSLVLGLILSISLLHAASPAIVGVDDTIAQNIRLRLSEIAEHSSLRDKSDLNLQEQVLQAIQPYGFFKARVTQLTRQSNGEIQSIHIQSGPAILIRRLHIELRGEGAHEEELLQAKAAISLRVGQVFNSVEYEAAKQSLFDAAEHQGYLRGRFSTARVVIDRQRYFVDINLLFETGPQFYFGQVRFNPTYISPQLLHRFVPFNIGQVYETRKVLEFNNALSGSGYFKSVTVKPEIGQQHYVPIEVHLEESARVNYLLGVGFGTDTGVRGKAGVSVNPLNRKGHKFNLMLRGSVLQNALQAQYIVPGHNPVTDQYDGTASLGTQNFDVGYSKSALATVAARHTTPQYQRAVSLNLLQEEYRYTAQPKRNSNLFFPRLNLTFTQSKDALFTPTGFAITLNGIAASDKILSDSTFVQGMVDGRAALTIPPIRTRFYAHSVQGYNTISNIDNMPLSLAFLLGGAENLKAYNINSIGPGKIVNYVGLELQKETWDNWYLVGFVDAGDVYNPTPRQFKYNTGAAVMWVSPVGPIKIGLAVPVRRSGQRIRGQKPQLVINMGPDI
ncbi:MAG: BamA/TamA family outer membrane protein [Legionellaceae bacterium]|nr:BamA/TamA family outer membrane protein [Legionellaceae bacterium]